MSVFVDSAYVSLLVLLLGVVAISGLLLTKCIEEEDAHLAWVWGALFLCASLGVAYSFWRFV